MRRFLAAVCLLGAGCSSVDDAKPLPPLLPLRVGANWTYSVADSGLLAILKDSTVTIHVTLEVAASGGPWFGVDNADSFGTARGFIWFANARGGVYQTDRFPGLSFLAWPYPVTAGDTLHVPVGSPMRVVSIDTLVVVPAGSFHCILYETLPFPSGTITQRTWFAPGIGLIKDVRLGVSDGKGNVGARVRILTSFTP